MKIPEIQIEIIETIMEGMKNPKGGHANLIKMVSNFNAEQPTLAFHLGVFIDGMSQYQKGTNVLLTCSAFIYKTIKDAIEAMNLEEQFGKKVKEK